jgi:hypothetical protein
VTGLLRRAEFYQDDVLFRRVTVGETSTAEPDDALFALPGGVYVWNVT